MKTSFKKIFVLLTFAAVLPFALSGCHKKGSFPNCKNDADCRVDASGKENNGVCYMGKCEECAQDTDCSDLKQCVKNRCLSSCQADADCGANSHCANNFCMANCSDNEGCPSAHMCANGRCVAEGSDPNTWANSDTVLANVYFDFDRYDVKAEYREQVSKLAKYLEANPALKLTIEGHTDDRGTPSYNLILSQKRADSVKNYLNTLGIASNRINTVALGEQQPAVNERTEYAWQQNRRAKFILEKN